MERREIVMGRGMEGESDGGREELKLAVNGSLSGKH